MFILVTGDWLVLQVNEHVLRRMRCGSHQENVAHLVAKQKRAEALSLQTWRTPVYIGESFFGCSLLDANWPGKFVQISLDDFMSSTAVYLCPTSLEDLIGFNRPWVGEEGSECPSCKG